MATMNKRLNAKGFFFNSRAKMLWWVSMAVFVCHQMLQKGALINIYWMDNWLDPFLFPIIVMPLLRWERETITGKAPYIFSGWETMVIISALVLVSELLFPFISNRFTADLIDVLVIIVGGYVYHKLMQ